MSITDTVKARIRQLVNDSEALSRGNQNDQCVDANQIASCSAWITAAQNIVHIAVPTPGSPYRAKADHIASQKHGFGIHRAVREFSAVIAALLADADAGLLASVADQASAATFDDFLDHADHYLGSGRKDEAGTISGVVFEDSLRRVCRKHLIPEQGVKLDELISLLAKADQLTDTQAKRARVCSHVRTKATHAQWAEFTPKDVQATIDFTRELVGAKLATA